MGRTKLKVKGNYAVGCCIRKMEQEAETGLNGNGGSLETYNGRLKGEAEHEAATKSCNGKLHSTLEAAKETCNGSF